MFKGNLSDRSKVDFLASRDESLKVVFDFLNSKKNEELEVGKIYIEGTELFGSYGEYESHAFEGAKFEAHRKYIDLQFLLEGKEAIAVCDLEKLQVTDDYDEENDFLLGLCQDGYDLVEMKAGDFLLLFPEDAHMPGVSLDKATDNKKIVVKIPV